MSYKNNHIIFYMIIESYTNFTKKNYGHCFIMRLEHAGLHGLIRFVDCNSQWPLGYKYVVLEVAATFPRKCNFFHIYIRIDSNMQH
jgi:hypothetical protein